MEDVTKTYTNGEVSIVWKPELCIHSGICFRGLNEVFDPKERPWVRPDAATSDLIVEQIKKCPSGALSYYLNKDATDPKEVSVEAETMIETSPNGPLLVYGNVAVKDGNGIISRKSNVTAFCRCGGSNNKPFCDGSHTKINFQG